MNGLISEILALTAGLNLLLVVSIIPFVREEYKNPSLLVWLSSIGLYVLSGFYLAILYFFAPSYFDSPSLLSVIGFFSLVVSYSGAICLFFYLSADTSWRKIGQISFAIGGINIALILIALKLPSELLSLGPSCWSLALSSWFLHKISSDKYPKSEYLVYALKVMAVAILLPSLAWIVLLLNHYYLIIPFLSKAQLVNLGDAIRIIRNLIAPLSFFIMFIYWMKYDSLFARKAKSDQAQVLELLREKDNLIYELSKVNSLASAGALAGGLAHELNQYLARIQINADHAFAQALNNSAYEIFQNPLKRILDANKEAAGMIGALRATFSARDGNQLLIEITDSVRDVTKLYRGRVAQSKIKLKVDIPDQIGTIDWGAQLSIVLSNLLLNAIEALDASSEPKKIVTITCEFIDHFVLIKIFDNGSAIHPSRVSSIFTLFSTTKKEGIGIGLWLSKFIMEKNGGDLSFENVNENGVEFVLKIPRIAFIRQSSPPDSVRSINAS